MFAIFKKNIWLGLFITGLLTALVVFGCVPDELEVEENILVVAHTAEVTTWDPSSSFSTEVTYMGNIYETLLVANTEDSPEPFTPVLAEEWDVSEDGLVWTFYIREGVTFHDGEKLNAEAVKKAIERTIERGEGASFIWAPVERIEVEDELVLTFYLEEVAPLDRIVSSSNGAWIMSPAAAEEGSEWFEGGRAAGTGPYQLESYSPAEEVILTRFDDYWGGWDEGQFDRVVVKIVSEAVVQRQLLEAGDAQIASVVPIEALSALEDNPEIKVYRAPSFYNYLGFLNTEKPPLDNVLVRQAVSYAIPYADIMEIATGGYATQSRGPVPTGLWPWQEDLPQYSYNLEKAGELLVEAGYEDGTLGGIEMVLTYAAENPAHERYAPLIQESLADIGIDLEVRPILWTSQWEQAKTDEPAEAQDIFLLLWWPTYADGYDNLSSLFTSGMYAYWNLSYWKSPDYDEMITEAYRYCVTNVEKSQELYFEAQKMLIDDAVALFFYDPDEIVPMRKGIKGEALKPAYPRVIFFYNLHTE